MKQSLLSIAVCLAVTCTAAKADITFDFEGTSVGDESAGLTTYMSGVYGSSVTVTDARVSTNTFLPPIDWAGNDTKFIRLALTGDGALEGDMEISFDETPISAVRFDGFVWLDDNLFDLGDLQLKAYSDQFTASGGTRGDPDPGSIVADLTWDPGTWNGFDSGWVVFDQPVTLLVFSDHSIYDIGVDNLQVRAVPAPGAALLGLLGMGLIGWTRKLFC